MTLPLTTQAFYRTRETVVSHLKLFNFRCVHAVIGEYNLLVLEELRLPNRDGEEV